MKELPKTLAQVRANCDKVESLLRSYPKEELVCLHVSSLEKEVPMATLYDLPAAFELCGRDGWVTEGDDLVKTHLGVRVSIYRVASLVAAVKGGAS